MDCWTGRNETRTWDRGEGLAGSEVGRDAPSPAVPGLPTTVIVAEQRIVEAGRPNTHTEKERAFWRKEPRKSPQESKCREPQCNAFFIYLSPGGPVPFGACAAAAAADLVFCAK